MHYKPTVDHHTNILTLKCQLANSWFLNDKTHIKGNAATLFFLQRFSRACAVNKYEANLVTFYLCFDSLAVTGCMHNTSRLWSDLSCYLGYWSHLNDGLRNNVYGHFTKSMCAKDASCFISINDIKEKSDWLRTKQIE